jgi:hypothetical protein
MTDKAPMGDCDNCGERITGDCVKHSRNGGSAACDTAYHYDGWLAMEVADAGQHEPGILCGICFRLVRQHNRPALDARAYDD